MTNTGRSCHIFIFWALLRPVSILKPDFQGASWVFFLFIFLDMNSTNTIGEYGERIACHFLKNKGYNILETNYTNKTGRRLGEIDIIAKKDSNIFFIEVKTKTENEFYFLPESAINKDKLKKLKKIADYYLKINDLWNIPYFFDAISVVISKKNNKATLKHLKNIFI
jgi:putative endonuclease